MLQMPWDLTKKLTIWVPDLVIVVKNIDDNLFKIARICIPINFRLQWKIDFSKFHLYGAAVTYQQIALDSFTAAYPASKLYCSQ